MSYNKNDEEGLWIFLTSGAKWRQPRLNDGGNRRIKHDKNRQVNQQPYGYKDITGSL